MIFTNFCQLQQKFKYSQWKARFKMHTILCKNCDAVTSSFDLNTVRSNKKNIGYIMGFLACFFFTAFKLKQ
jgi:hypothetical protein